jgi:hypothetical protein
MKGEVSMDTVFRVLLLLAVTIGILCVVPGILLISKSVEGKTEIDLPHIGTVKTTSYGVICLFFGAFFFSSATVGYAQSKNWSDQIDSLKKRLAYEDWTIEVRSTGLGKIQDSEENTGILVLMRPPVSDVGRDGIVELVDVHVPKDLSTGELDFPMIYLFPPPTTNGAYGWKTVDPNNKADEHQKIQMHSAERKVVINGNFELPYAGPYDSSRATANGTTSWHKEPGAICRPALGGGVGRGSGHAGRGDSGGDPARTGSGARGVATGRPGVGGDSLRARRWAAGPRPVE